MHYNLVKKIKKVWLSVIFFICIIMNSQTVFAADNTVRIYIGEGEDARHHMSLKAGGISDEYRYELKGYQAKSSVYSSSDTSAFQIVKTGNGKCKVKGLKEGSGWVVLTIKTTDGKTLTERIFISVYTEVSQCDATALKETGVYRGASANAEVENNDKTGTILNKEEVTVLRKCGDYYYIKRKNGSGDTGYALKKDLRIFVKDVKLKEQNVSIETAKSVQFNVKVTPELADNPKISWQSGNNTVASVDDSGTVTGKSEGTTTITAATTDGSNLTESTYISIYRKIDEIQGYIKSNTDLYAVGNNKLSIGIGKSKNKLTVVGICGDYYRVKTDIQVVKENYGGYCYVPKSKIAIPVAGISLNAKEEFLSPGQTLQLSATISPRMADNHNIRWDSTKEKVAIVEQNGYVTAKKSGRTEIVAVSADGSKTAKCVIHVKENKEKNKKVISKPDLSLESNNMNSISITVSNDIEFDGMLVYVNGKKWDDHKFKRKGMEWIVSYGGFRTNKTYRIKVKTYTEKSSKRIYSKMSSEQKITVGKTNINANITANRTITVRWKKIKDAKNYKIYRAEKKNGNYKLIKTVNGNKASYADKGVKLNKTYYYKVKPVAANGTKASSNIDYAKVCKIGSAGRYLAKKYNFVCTDSNKKINDYHIKGHYPPVKYKMAGNTLQIHVYLEFVTYSDTGKVNSGKIKIFKKKAASVNSEISTDKYISMFKEGIKEAYSGVKVRGNKGDFKKGINFNTELIVHEKGGKEKYHSGQQFIEVLIGGECPNCTKKGDHWYHAGSNDNASGYVEYDYIYCIYMPTDEQVRANNGYNVPATDYDVTAAHEMGHILGLDDAYYDDENGYDRCADNNETGYEYDKKKYDNLMKDHGYYKKINANGIEMMLKAVNLNTGEPDFASQCFKSYGNETISDVIKNHTDNQKDYD